MFDLTTAAVICSLGLATFFLGLWIYYDRRDHAWFETERRRTIFHCVRCDHLYAMRGEAEEDDCPQCGHHNARLRF